MQFPKATKYNEESFRAFKLCLIINPSSYLVASYDQQDRL